MKLRNRKECSISEKRLKRSVSTTAKCSTDRKNGLRFENMLVQDSGTNFN